MTGRVPVATIKRKVADEFLMPIRIMESPHQDRASTLPRQVAMALSYDLAQVSNAIVGRVFGGRDHTTVIYARRVVARARRADPKFDERIRRVERELKNLPPPWEGCEAQLGLFVGPLFDFADQGDLLDA